MLDTHRVEENDAFGLASEYLELTRRWRAGHPPLSSYDFERRGTLRVRLEHLLTKDETPPSTTCKRRSLRVPTLQAVEFTDGERRICGWLTEIAEGGVFVATESPFEHGTRMRIEIVCEDETLHLAHAEVRWSRIRPAGGLPSGMGLAFEELDDGQFAAVVDLMEKAIFLTLAQE